MTQGVQTRTKQWKQPNKKKGRTHQLHVMLNDTELLELKWITRKHGNGNHSQTIRWLIREQMGQERSPT